MPFFSLGRLLIYKEKETHREKMHVHPGSHKHIFIWEIGAIINLQPVILDGVIHHPAARYRLLNYFFCRVIL